MFGSKKGAYHKRKDFFKPYNHLKYLIIIIVFILITLAVSYYYLNISGRVLLNNEISSPDNPYGIDSEIESIASANNMKLLNENEVAIIKIPKAMSKKTIKNIFKGNAPQDNNDTVYIQTLSDETQLIFDEDEYARLIIEGSDEKNIFIPSDKSVTIIEKESLEIEITVNEGIDPKVREKVNENKIVKVIIEFNVPYKSYYNDDPQFKKENKSKIYEDIKDKLKNKISKSPNSKIKSDLKIISAISADIDKQALDELENDANIKRIVIDPVVNIALTESVPMINAERVWNLFDSKGNPITGNGMKIAIIDTGVDYTHKDLGICTKEQFISKTCSKVIGGYDFVNNDNDPMDDHGHGTHVAATAAGKGLLNGVAPDAYILAYKVLSSSGSGSGSAIISAIDYATDPNRDGNTSDHVDVGSMSLGGAGNPGDSMSLAVDKSSAQGVIWTIAAGNSGPSYSTIGSPGTARTAITVAAACKTSQIGKHSYCSTPIASFSSRGPVIWNDVDIKKPDIAAPGVLICAAEWDNAWSSSRCLDNIHVAISGTSMATPHVAGAATLVKQAYPNYSPEQIKELLKITATDLGLTYNDQGAGLINLYLAIPFSTSISSTPELWAISTNPTQKFSTITQTFSVKSLNTNLNQLSIGFNLNVSGISINSTKSVITVPNLGSDTFIATITVNNDIAKSGLYVGGIIFSENGTIKGGIPIRLIVNPTITTIPSSPQIDYGLDNPSLSTFVSDYKNFTLVNLRKDISQILTITPPNYPSGVTTEIPSSIVIPADSYTTINSRVSVVNSILQNGIYQSYITLSNPANRIIVQTKFAKYYALRITATDNIEDIWYIQVHNRKGKEYYAFPEAGSTNPQIIYITENIPHDAIIKYSSIYNAGGTTEYTIFREGVTFGSNGIADIFVNRNDASYLVKFNGYDINRKLFSSLVGGFSYVYTPYGKEFKLYILGGGGGDESKNYFSNISKDYAIKFNYKSNSEGTASCDPTLSRYYFNKVMAGISGPMNIESDSNISVLNLKYDINFYKGSILPVTEYNSFACYSTTSSIPVPDKQTFYFSPATEEGRFSVYRANINRVNCPASGACPYMFSTPFSRIINKTRWIYSNYEARGNLIPTWDGNTQYVGLGPSVWFIKMQNSATQIKFEPYYSPGTSSYYRNALLRQDFSIQEYNSIPFTIYKDGIVHATGVFPSNKYIVNPITASPSTYQMNASYSYMTQGTNMTAKVTETFNTALSDPNPPAIKRLYQYTDGLRKDVYMKDKTNSFEIQLDPVGGVVSQFTAYYSIDNGLSYVPLTVSTLADSTYRFTLPNSISLNKIDIKIDAVDSSSNRLVFEFSIPANLVAPLLGVPAAPTNLIATAVSSSTINLNWADNSNTETAFVIERSDGGGAFNYKAKVYKDVTAYSDTSIKRVMYYEYRVRAYGSTGYSDYSNVAGVTPLKKSGGGK